MKKILKVGTYSRVSHEEQKKFGFSISAQIDKLKAWCEENGYILVESFVDEGYTASNMKRPALQEMLSRLDEFDVIAFTRLDRFSRNVLDANKTLELLKQHNVAMISIEEDDIDTTSADGMFMFNLKVNLAERELRKTSERIKSVFEYKIKEGQPICGKQPFGYVNGTIDGQKRVVKDKETEHIINALFEHFGTYHSVRKTMIYINETFGLTFAYNSYIRMLKKKCYVGIYQDNESYYPPYITLEEYEKNQQIIKNNMRERKNKNVFLFSGLIKCPYCGRSLVGQRKLDTRYNRVYYLYRCQNHHVQSRCNFNRVLNEATLFESYIVDNIDRLISEYIITVEEVKPVKMDNSKARMSEIRGEMENLNYLFVKGRLKAETYDKMYEELEKELETLKKNANDTVDTSHLKEFLNSGWRNIYDELTRENKRALWQNIIKGIELDKELNIGIKFF